MQQMSADNKCGGLHLPALMQAVPGLSHLVRQQWLPADKRLCCTPNQCTTSNWPDSDGCH